MVAALPRKASKCQDGWFIGHKNGEARLACRESDLHLIVDVDELSVAIRMASPSRVLRFP